MMPNYKGISSFKQANRKKSEGKSSKFFGVYWHKPRRKWRAMMRQIVNGKSKQIYLGSCNEEADAATLYVLKATKYYGQPVRQDDLKKLGVIQD